MTLSDIRDRVRAFLKEPTATFWSDAELNNWINEAQIEVVNAVNDLALTKFQQESYITADGASEQYELPSDYLRGLSLEDNSGTSYRFLPINLYLKKEEALSYKENAIFSIWNNAIYVWKNGAVVPVDTQIHLFFIRRPADLVADTDETELPEQFIPALIYNTVVKALLKEENPEIKNYNDLYVSQLEVINGKYVAK